MRSFKSLYLFIITFVFAISAHAHYYDTLPKGVRLLGYRFVQTGDIDRNFDDDGKQAGYQFSINANAQSLSGFNAGLDSIFSEISAMSGSELSLGSYKVSGSSQVRVHGTGFAYGYTDRLTFYTIVPKHTAQTNLKFEQTAGGNGIDVSNNINANSKSDYDNMISNAVKAAYGAASGKNVLGSVAQGVLVNALGYKPVGNWYGEDYGDMELGTTYQLYKDSQRGAATTLGLTLPTGRTDDPDILQDIGFGDGQFDLYAELGGGHHLAPKWFFNAYARYTYQFADKRTFRIPYAQGALTDRKENIRFKLGNRITFNTSTEYVLNDWFAINTGYEVNKEGKSQFYSSDSEANRIMAMGSDTVAHQLYTGLSLSSITPFMKKKFLLPAKIEFIYRGTIGGRNTAKVDRYELDFRMMF